MKVLVDGSLPATLSDRPNPEGVVIDRLTGPLDDVALVTYAADHSYAVVVVSEPEVLAQQRVRAVAEARSVALVYLVTDDPAEAETSLRHGLRSLMKRAKHSPGGVFRMGRSGVELVELGVGL